MTRGRLALLLTVLAAATVGAGAAPATGQAPPTGDERDGQRLLRDREDGRRTCGSLSERDFERIGDYVMAGLAGGPGSHRSMDDLMESMMGSGASRQMHEVMGRRVARCPGGRVPSELSGMTGMMQMMGGGFGPRGLMGGPTDARRFEDDDGDGDEAVAWVMAGLMLLLIAGAGVALWRWRPAPRQARESATEILDRRLAAGEIDRDDYEQRLSALKGAT